MANIVKIKGKPVGIFGLELALGKVRSDVEKGVITKEQAPEALLKVVEKKNYIPEASRKEYLLAFGRLLSQQESKDDHLEIRILGPGCVGCNNMEKLVLEILSERKMAADIFHVTDRDEIHRYGVSKTPALMINGKIVSEGPIPSKAQIEMWLLDA